MERSISLVTFWLKIFGQTQSSQSSILDVVTRQDYSTQASVFGMKKTVRYCPCNLGTHANIGVQINSQVAYDCVDIERKFYRESKFTYSIFLKIQ